MRERGVNDLSILKFLSSSNFGVYNKEIAKKIGLHESILLGELANQQDYWNTQNKLVDGYFYATVEKIESETTLSGHQQRQALKTLQTLELADVVKKGVPATRYIKLNEECIHHLLFNFLTTSSEEIKQQDVKEVKSINNNTNNNTNNNKNKLSKDSLANLIPNKKLTKKDKYLIRIEKISLEYDFSETLFSEILKFFEDKIQKGIYEGDNYIRAQFEQLAKLSEKDAIEGVKYATLNGYKGMYYESQKQSKRKFDDGVSGEYDPKERIENLKAEGKELSTAEGWLAGEQGH